MNGENPFTLLTLIAAPAVLTNASCLLALNTANRYGRAFDRTKEVGRDLEHAPDDGLLAFRVELLHLLIARATLLLRAQTAFYLAIGLYVLSAVGALVGAALGIEHPALLGALAATSFALGALATVCVVVGCMFTVLETRLAMEGLRQEENLLVARHSRGRRGR
jgi:hypothetical protein